MANVDGNVHRTSLALVAHCDDLELGLGGTVAKLVSRGWTFHVFVLSSQRRRRDSDTSEEIEGLAAMREREALEGAGVLGMPRESSWRQVER